MFGVIVASRPVDANPQTISPTQFAFTLPSQPFFSHIVVFLLPGSALPPDTAAAVYIQLPPSQEFKLLGAIANEKQSAIFKVKNSALSVNDTASLDDAMTDDTNLAGGNTQNTGGPDIVLGISIEPAANIQAQLAALANNSTPQLSSTGSELVRHQPQPSIVSTKVLAQRIIQNAFNFLSSFAGGSGGKEVVPLKSFQNWWTKFEKRIELDPSFLERDEQN